MTPDVAVTALASGVGVFFGVSGWHKLTNPGRHAELVKTLQDDGVPLVGLMEWWVPGWELVAGASLAVGFVPRLAAAVLLAICLVACWVDGRKRVEGWKPLDFADRVDDWLYLPEVVYAAVLVVRIITL